VARELVHQIGRVAGDLPRVLTAPLYRSWHLRGTDAEVAAPMPPTMCFPAPSSARSGQ
jgi:hypothetical protein